MLDDLSPEICDRIHSNPIGPVLERHVEYLRQRGYSHRNCWRYLRVGEHFGHWLGHRRISPQTVRQFIDGHLPVCRCAERNIHDVAISRAGLRILVEMLGVQPSQPPLLPGYPGRLLQQYAQHLTTVRGLMAASVKQHLVYTRRMLKHLRICRASQLRELTPLRIDRYLTRHRPGRTAHICIRSFLRFLLQQGLVHRDLSIAVPRFVRWRLAALPPTLTKEEVGQLLRSADCRTRLGLRNRAILLCLSELGLRASDVANLQLQDVDLPQRTLRLHRCKQRETGMLPIPPRLASGLQDYLRNGRPVCSSSFLFVRLRAPFDKSLSRGTMRDVIRYLARRAGLQDRVRGTHILRHSLARRLLAAGASLKQIADLLGHKSIDTTAIYAKVDLDALCEVALPWPCPKKEAHS